MRPPRHSPPTSLGFFQSDIESELLQACHEPNIAVAARRLHVEHPGAEFGQAVFAEEIPEQVHRLAVQLGREFDTADEFYAAFLRDRNCLIKSSKSIVIG